MHSAISPETLRETPPELCTPETGCLHCEVRPISVCGAMEEHELVELAAMAERRSFQARETVTLQGDSVDVVYNVTIGALRLYSLLPDGRRHVVGFLLPGDFLGLAMAERSAFSADAIIESRACCFRRRAFMAFLDRKPHLLQRLHRAAADEMTLAQRRLVLLGQARAETRILAFVLDMWARWSTVCGKNSVTVPLPMTRQDIADHLGLTIGTVSRTLTQLERDRRLLIVPGGVRLLDLAMVEATVAAG